MERWRLGDSVLLREVWKGRVCTAWPMRVVLDREDLLVLYMVPGTILKRSAGSDGRLLRMPADDWKMVDDVWRGTAGILRISMPAKRYSVIVPPPDWDFDGWYINLEEPLRRTRLGFDYKDLLLDVLLERDLRSWRWKDRDDLLQAVAEGLFPSGLVTELEGQGEAAVHEARSGSPMFHERWREWRPDTAWPVPVLPESWESVD
jgi:Protein of unknown function (DUF402)